MSVGWSRACVHQGQRAVPTTHVPPALACACATPPASRPRAAQATARHHGLGRGGRALTQCGRPWQARRAPARAPEFALARPGRIRLPPRNQKRTLEPARICRQSRDKAQPGHSRSIDQSMDGSTEGTRGVVPSRVLPLAGGDGFQEPHGIQAHRAQLSGTAAQVRGPSW